MLSFLLHGEGLIEGLAIWLATFIAIATGLVLVILSRFGSQLGRWRVAIIPLPYIVLLWAFYFWFLR
jgi:hypothetical protein